MSIFCMKCNPMGRHELHATIWHCTCAPTDILFHSPLINFGRMLADGVYVPPKILTSLNVQHLLWCPFNGILCANVIIITKVYVPNITITATVNDTSYIRLIRFLYYSKTSLCKYGHHPTCKHSFYSFALQSRVLMSCNSAATSSHVIDVLHITYWKFLCCYWSFANSLSVASQKY